MLWSRHGPAVSLCAGLAFLSLLTAPGTRAAAGEPLVEPAGGPGLVLVECAADGEPPTTGASLSTPVHPALAVRVSPGRPFHVRLLVRNAAPRPSAAVMVRVRAWRSGMERVSTTAWLPPLAPQAEHRAEVRLSLPCCGTWTLLGLLDVSDAPHPGPAAQRVRRLTVLVAEEQSGSSPALQP